MAPMAEQGASERSDVNVRLPRELVEEVRELARRHDRSLAAELRVGLADYVRRISEADRAERLREREESEDEARS